MYRLIAIILTLLFAPLMATSAWSGEIIAVRDAIPNQYIVVLKPESFDQQTSARGSDRRQQVRDVVRSIGRQHRSRPGQVFTDAIQGFTVSMNSRAARRLARDSRVAYVIEDSWVRATGADVQFDPPSWGLDRIDQREQGLDGVYQHLSFTSDMAVHVYVIDSGIRSTHQDFAGRVDTLNSFTAYADGHGSEDCHGHGTHVAGVIGGELHGVAKQVTLHPVRVLNCWAGGPISSVIAGVDWVTAQVNDNPQAAVANMSLIAAASRALDDAVRASIAAGITYVVAAGNNGADACNYSPARVAEALTIGASTKDDLRLLSSNYGECVDLYAPGTGIRSASNGSDSATSNMTGTSAASPHVAGIAALLLGQAPASTPADIADLIIANATQTGNSFLPDASDLLAFGLIDLGTGEPEPTPEPDLTPNLDFSMSCHARSRRCTFEAIMSDETVSIEMYHWDFGDGNTQSHDQPIARNSYQVGGTVNVILAAALPDGGILLVDREIDLPF